MAETGDEAGGGEKVDFPSMVFETYRKSQRKGMRMRVGGVWGGGSPKR